MIPLTLYVQFWRTKPTELNENRTKTNEIERKPTKTNKREIIMAKAKAQLITDIDDLDDGDFEELGEEEQLDNQLATATNSQKKTFNFVDAMSGKDDAGNGKIKIIRQLADGSGSTEVIGTYPMDYFGSYDDSIEFIRKKWGAGIYIFQAKVPNDKGRVVLAGRELIRIAEEKSGDTPKSGSSDIKDIMENQQSFFRELLEKQNPEKAMSFKEIIENVSLVTVAIAPILAIYMESRPKQSNSMKDFKEMFSLVNDLKMDSGEEDEEDEGGLMGMLSHFATALSKTPAGQAHTANQAGQVIDGQASAIPVSSDDPVYAGFATMFEVMLKAAQSGADSKALAMEMGQGIPEDQRSGFLDLLRQPNLYSFICNYNQSFIKHMDWLNDFVYDLTDCLENPIVKDLQPNEKPVNNSQNNADGPINAETSKTGSDTDDDGNGATVKE